MAIVETQKLTKRYGREEALKNLDLVVEPGDIYGFIGPNGAGKTTTLRILSTLLAPTFGKAIVEGVDVMNQPYEV